MAERGGKTWIGVGAVVLGVLLSSMLFFELSDGTLYGSKSEGMTVEAHPVVFYVGIVIQSLCVLLLLSSGFSILRKREN